MRIATVVRTVRRAWPRSARLCIPRLPCRAQVQDGKDHRDHHEYVADGSSSSEVEIDERQLVRLRGQRLRRVRWAALGQAEDEVEHLDGVHDPEYEHDADDRAQ